MILLDTSGLLAGYNAADPHHAGAGHILAMPQRRILSPFVLAELDYMSSRVGGQEVELRVLDDVARGVYELQTFTEEDVSTARDVVMRYASLRMGLADASIVVLAHRYRCFDVLTLDERHFRTVVGPNGDPFRLLPADAE